MQIYTDSNLRTVNPNYVSIFSSENISLISFSKFNILIPAKAKIIPSYSPFLSLEILLSIFPLIFLHVIFLKYDFV